MSNDQRVNINGSDGNDDEYQIRDIHALTPVPQVGPNRARQRETWETSIHRTSSLSASSEGTSSENFTSMSREFNALVIAGSTIGNNGSNISDNDGGGGGNHGNINLGRIGEEEMLEETNPLAIVPDNNPLDPVPAASPRRSSAVVGSTSSTTAANVVDQVTMQQVKRDEIETKIFAWQTAKIAKINNRFKREDAIINGLESEQAQKATTWMKRVERKLEEERARALEKMQNDIAKARRKAEEKRASAEAKRGTKVARVLEIANLMRTLGRAPSKRSFF